MDATVQMNTRIGRAAKERGDRVLAQRGITPSHAVRALWDYLGRHQDVPAFMAESQRDTAQVERTRKIARIRNDVGLANRIAREQCGYTGPAGHLLDGKTWRELRDEMYDDMLDEMEGRCG